MSDFGISSGIATGFTGSSHIGHAANPAATPTVNEIALLIERYTPSWLYVLMTGDNIVTAALVPGLAVLLVTVLTKMITHQYIVTIPSRVRDMWLWWSGYVERSIEVTQSSDYQAKKRINDGLNKELQTAIKLYIGNNADKCHETLARLSLLETADVRSNSRSWSRLNIHRSSDDLKRMKLIVQPEPSRVFMIPNTAPPIYLKVDIKSEPTSNQWEKRLKTTFVLTTRHVTNEAGRAYIDTFVKKCYEQYRSTMDATKKQGRFLYQLQTQKSEGMGGVMVVKGMGDGEENAEEKAADADIPPPSRFKRYKLSDDKDFDSLFFPGKADILRLVDDFRNSQGKFGIEGFPRKLGLLLSGPSGTGKTAFVKALATYLGRHIITIQLEKIKTNQQLYDIMFEEQYVCSNTDKGKAEMIPNNQVIFLMEVDGAFDIVKSRKAGPETSSTSTPQLKSDRMRDLLFNRADQLDLAGLLNALDGVVDSPGRVVIMSTSAVAELDAALIRPGRINRILHMNYLTLPCAKELLTHHFGVKAFEGGVEARFEAEWARKEAEAADPTISRTASYMSPQAIVAFRSRSPSQQSPPATPRPLGINSASFDVGRFHMAPAELEQLCIDNDTLEEVLVAFTRYPEVDELI